MPEKVDPISIMIHDLNPWGGQDRSTLEIVWRLNKRFPIKIHSFTLEGYENWPDMEHVQYEALVKKPIIFKYLSYQLKSWTRLNSSPTSLIQSTGTASLKSNVVQVQFVHNTWLKIAKNLPLDKFQNQNPIKQLYHSFLKYYKMELERSLYKPNKHYIAISHGIKKELMSEFNIPSENISIIHHGVDTQHFTPIWDSHEAQNIRKEVRSELGIKEDDRVLLHVGALNARKGIFQTLRVLDYLKKNEFTGIKYLAVGQGDREKLEALVKDHNLQDWVIFAPHTKDIRRYYWASDVFFFPTFYEPFGMVILEAMACGLPSVVSSQAGGAEMIEEGESGLLFDPNDQIQNLANILLPLLRDKTLSKQIGLAGRRVAEQRSWDQVGEEYIKLYEKLIHKQ